jgi:hypothetical protein
MRPGVTLTERAMNYMLLIYSDEAARQTTSEAEMGRMSPPTLHTAKR